MGSGLATSLRRPQAEVESACAPLEAMKMVEFTTASLLTVKMTVSRNNIGPR